jgi:penicillin-binding protein 2
LKENLKKYLVLGIIAAVFLLLGSRLYVLQIVDQQQYGKDAERNSVRKIVVMAPRGLMYDRNGKVLVDNIPSYTLTIIPKKFDRANLSAIASLIDEDTTYITGILDKQTGTNRFNPAIIKRNINFKLISYIEENRDRLSGVDYQVEALRTYPAGVRGSHMFGYVNEISDEQLEKQPDNYYKQGDLVGVTGLEKFYELNLRGEKGLKLVTADVNGRILGSYNDGKDDVNPKNGEDLMLSVDGDLQAYAEKLLGNRRGAIIAVDPRNGEVLCLVSKPDFDLTIFTGDKKNKDFSFVFNDQSHPLFNRVTQTKYPPGSTWKMMMSLAGLGSGKITTSSTIACGGSFTFGNRTFGDHGAYGNIGVSRALEVSSNVFFYKLSLLIGLENYTKFAKIFGFGNKTGIDLPNETTGLLPSEEYFNKVYGEGKWGQGLLVSLGIGQGELGVSPVQMVAYTAAIAMNGLYTTPHLVRDIKNISTGKNETLTFPSRKIDLPQSYFDVVKKGMYLVVNGGGTAKNIKNDEFTIAGKTGTAQNTNANNHSWFVGFAPFNDPQIAVCVMGENQGWGNEFAAPIAASIIVRYLSKNSQDVYENIKSTESVRD